MLKIIGLVALIFPSFASANNLVETFTKEDGKTFNYLLKEAESLRFRRLYAAESAKNSALLAETEEEKITSMARYERNTEEAEHASKLDSALNKVITEVSYRNYTDVIDCEPQLKRYDSAKQMILRLQADGFLEAKTASYFIESYNDSIVMYKLLAHCPE